MNIPTFSFAFEYAGASDTGRMRKENQDRIVLDETHGFFAVSDGMGGLRCGADAASYVCASIPRLLTICAEEGAEDEPVTDQAERLRQLVCMLSDQLYRTGNADGRFDYGATLVGVWLCQDCAAFVSLGDSRGYLLTADENELIQITQDMNIAGIMERNGQLTHSQARLSPASSQLTAFVGMAEPATPETFVRKLCPGDTLLLCSDGLHSMVPEDEISEILRADNEPQEICQALINAANAHGGRDNISCVVIKVR